MTFCDDQALPECGRGIFSERLARADSVVQLSATAVTSVVHVTAFEPGL